MGGAGKSCLFSQREKRQDEGPPRNHRGLSKSATLAVSHTGYANLSPE